MRAVGVPLQRLAMNTVLSYLGLNNKTVARTTWTCATALHLEKFKHARKVLLKF